LGGEDGSHHSSSDSSGSKLRGNDSRQGVVTTDTDTLKVSRTLGFFFLFSQTTHHDESPHDDDSVDVDAERLTGDGLSERSNHDDHQFDTVHLLSSEVVGEESEEQLTAESSDRVGDLDTEVLVGGVGATVVVDVSEHGRGDRDRAGALVVRPRKRSLPTHKMS
jgi:hypothetical protein